jgi:predicted RNase H-like HicB family nuclease
MLPLQFNGIVWKEGEYFVAQCLNVEVSSFGSTKEEALANLNEALELYLEDGDMDNISEVKEPELFKTQVAHA